MPTPTPIRFDLIGANDRTRNALQMAFAGRAKGTCEFAAGGVADAVIVDLDGIGARAEWSKYRHQHPQRPSVLLTVHDCTVPETAIVLIKPIRIEALLSAVDDVRRRIETGDINAPGITVRASTGSITALGGPTTTITTTTRPSAREATAASQATRGSQTRRPVKATAAAGIHPPTSKPAAASAPEPVRDFRDVCGNHPDINCEDLEQVRQRSFDAEGTLLDWLRRTQLRSDNVRRAVSLNIQDKDVAIISSTERTARVFLNDEILKNNATKRFIANQVRMTERATGHPEAADKLVGEPVTLEALLWKMALWTYQGRLPAGTSVRERVFLRRWPNLPRLLEIPDAMRIAALLVEQPLALPRVAEALQIPQRHVFAFYGAAQAAGLANHAKREADNLVATVPPRKHVERSFINRVVGRLKRLVA
jgi:hypothetical protein